ncbi:hypothetical protein [Streptomyces shenzhenensis]|uniref:hypothetical protein n=1 Tax=Streptomyces shenzhenensis TaxID=943815 RepID=UPI001F31A401|nr:hypothetical protein [Streptomyces shenzhenensis]
MKAGDTFANSVPGVAGTEAHQVTAAIVTYNDHDFVDLTIRQTASGATAKSTLQAGAKAVAGSTVKKAARKAAFELAAVPSTLTASHVHCAVVQ